VRLDPAAAFQPVEGGIQRPLLDCEDILRNLLDTFGNRPAMLRAQGNRFENEQVEGALRKFDSLFGHLRSSLPYCFYREIIRRFLSKRKGKFAAYTVRMKTCLLAVVLGTAALHAQPDSLEGLWQGYDGEWGHVSRQLIALAEATPADKFAWRPAPGVRSMSEVYMHIALANFYLLSVTGPKMPPELKQDSEKKITSKAEVIDWLKRSLDAVKTAHAAVKHDDLARKVKVNGRDATVEGMYLRIIVHANEHMGQLIAYARMNGIVPPWSS